MCFKVGHLEFAANPAIRDKITGNVFHAWCSKDALVAPSSGYDGALSAFKSVAGDKLPRVNKVDVMEARQGLHSSGGGAPTGRITHAPYRREPYVRVQLDDGRTVDAKAAAWTRTHVLLHWKDDDGKAWNVWVVAVRVRRITAEESGWRDPYDLEW